MGQLEPLLESLPFLSTNVLLPPLFCFMLYGNIITIFWESWVSQVENVWIFTPEKNTMDLYLAAYLRLSFSRDNDRSCRDQIWSSIWRSPTTIFAGSLKPYQTGHFENTWGFFYEAILRVPWWISWSVIRLSHCSPVCPGGFWPWRSQEAEQRATASAELSKVLQELGATELGA